MSYPPSSWLLLVLGALLLLPVAHAQQPPTAPPAPSVPPPKPDPAAVKAFDRSLALYGPKREGWLKTTLWQEVNVQGLAFHTEGLYLSGPNQRLRLDLNVRVGGTAGQMQLVSDGTTFWQFIRIGAEKPLVNKYQVKKVFAALSTPDTVPQVRDEFLQTQSFLGVAPLLQNLQQQLVFTRVVLGQWQGHKAHVLTGVWSASITADVVKAVGGMDKWPVTLPRRAVVYLDAQSSWPLRLEWRGGPPKAEEGLLMQMEFRDPHFLAADAPPPPEYAGKFVFDERNLQVTDQTREVTEQFKARSRQLASQKRPDQPGQPASPSR